MSHELVALDPVSSSLREGGPGAGARRRPSAAAMARVIAHVPLRVLRASWLLIVVLLTWQLAANAYGSLFFPPPSQIAKNVKERWITGDVSHVFTSDLFREQAGASLTRFALGWLLAIVLGVLIGALLGASRRAALMYNPVVRFFASIPNTVLLPIAVQVFGVADRMNVFLICLGSIWVIIINTADGVAGVDQMWLRSAASLRLGAFTRYRRVVLPAAMPQIMAGLRVSLGIALILMVIAELYATTKGLGHQVVVAQSSFRYLDMWGAFAVIGVVGVVLNAIFGAIERRVLRWQRRGGLGEL